MDSEDEDANPAAALGALGGLAGAAMYTRDVNIWATAFGFVFAETVGSTILAVTTTESAFVAMSVAECGIFVFLLSIRDGLRSAVDPESLFTVQKSALLRPG